MKEIFDIRRFVAYALKWHRENIRVNLFFMAVITLITFLVLCKFNPFLIEYTHVPTEKDVMEFISHYKKIYSQVFNFLVVICSLFAALYSFRDIMSKVKQVNALLLPVSNFERFLLAFLNSTVVVFVVYLFLFYGVASVTNSYKYVGMKNMHFVEGGLLGNQLPFMGDGQQVTHTQIGNVLVSNVKLRENILTVGSNVDGSYYSIETPSPVSKGWVFCINLMIFLFLVGLGMWGAITFRRHPLISTMLVHILLGVIWLIACILMARKLMSLPYTLMKHSGINFYEVDYTILLPSAWWLMLLYVIPLAYLYIAWIKLKTKHV